MQTLCITPPLKKQKTVLYISHEFTQAALDRTAIIRLFTLLLFTAQIFRHLKKGYSVRGALRIERKDYPLGRVLST